jgi:P27 family predicted phage terminase small subunit
MKPGPRKKLPEIDRIEGNPSKKVIEASGIEGLGEPFIAEHLMEDARGCMEVVRQSMPPRIYSALDSFILAAFATAWAIHKRATEEMTRRDFEWIVENSAGSETSSPWIKIANTQATLMASLGDRLGLDPKSRAALKLPAARQQREPIESLIGPKRSYASLRN